VDQVAPDDEGLLERHRIDERGQRAWQVVAGAALFGLRGAQHRGA
jgi:hypothetical protein